MTDSPFDLVIIKRDKLHSHNDIRKIPLTTLVGPCFVVYHKHYCQSQDIEVIADDRTVYVIEPIQLWGDLFLPWLEWKYL